jgi:hypothetical protein
VSLDIGISPPGDWKLEAYKMPHFGLVERTASDEAGPRIVSWDCLPLAQGLPIEAAATSVIGRFATTRERALVSRSYTYTERLSVLSQGFSAGILPLWVP